MKYRHAAALVFTISIYPTLAMGQDRGSTEDQEACTPDVFRLCQDLIPDETAILACLQSKKTQLSPACGLVLFPPDQAKTHKKH